MVVMACHIMSCHVMDRRSTLFSVELCPRSDPNPDTMDSIAGQSGVQSGLVFICDQSESGREPIPVRMVVSRLSMGLFDRDSLAIAVAPHPLNKSINSRPGRIADWFPRLKCSLPCFTLRQTMLIDLVSTSALRTHTTQPSSRSSLRSLLRKQEPFSVNEFSFFFLVRFHALGIGIGTALNGGLHC